MTGSALAACRDTGTQTRRKVLGVEDTQSVVPLGRRVYALGCASLTGPSNTPVFGKVPRPAAAPCGPLLGPLHSKWSAFRSHARRLRLVGALRLRRGRLWQCPTQQEGGQAYVFEYGTEEEVLRPAPPRPVPQY